MKKRALIIIGIVVAAIALFGLYLVYLNFFVNQHRLTLDHKTVTTSEYRNIAAESSIMPSYMWRRMQNILMDGDYLMSDYMLEGRLAGQDAEPSGKFLLADQSDLLLRYLASSDRSSARSLVKAVNRDFRNENGSYRAAFYKDGTEDTSYTNSDEMIFLEAYIEYYSAYGSKDDLTNIQGLMRILFDDSGMIKPEQLKGTTYVDDISEEEESYVFTGVKIADINLELISNLEKNGMLPAGITDKYKGIVKGALVSAEVPYYAYAYVVKDSGDIDYVYAGNEAATISIADSLRTMINLARVDELPQGVYYQFKTDLINEGILRADYSLMTNNLGGDEIPDSYCDALQLAKLEEDTDLFSTLCRILAVRVATKSDSPAIYLIFHNVNNRYIFYTHENIKTYLVVNGMFAV